MQRVDPDKKISWHIHHIVKTIGLTEISVLVHKEIVRVGQLHWWDTRVNLTFVNTILNIACLMPHISIVNCLRWTTFTDRWCWMLNMTIERLTAGYGQSVLDTCLTHRIMGQMVINNSIVNWVLYLVCPATHVCKIVI